MLLLMLLIYIPVTIFLLLWFTVGLCTEGSPTRGEFIVVWVTAILWPVTIPLLIMFTLIGASLEKWERWRKKRA